MVDISFRQQQPTRTRFVTDRSVRETRRAVKDALDGCRYVAAWNDDGTDVYAESDAGRFDDGYRSNVDVYERDGRTHVLVDSTPLRFVGSLDGSWRRAYVDVRPDQFHDAVVTAIVDEVGGASDRVDTDRTTDEDAPAGESDAESYEKAVPEREDVETESRDGTPIAVAVFLFVIGGLLVAGLLAAPDAADTGGLLAVVVAGGLAALAVAVAMLR